MPALNACVSRYNFAQQGHDRLIFLHFLVKLCSIVVRLCSSEAKSERGIKLTRALNKLSALAVKNAGPGKLSDGGGLWLYKRDEGPGQWVFRYTMHRRRREMGLGSVQDVSLKDARETADKWRSVVAKGLDPINERERERR